MAWLCEEELSVGKQRGKRISGENKYLSNDSLQESETRGRDPERLTERIPPDVVT